MPSFERLQVEHAEQRVAAADIGVEEAERLAGLDRLDPQRDLGQLDRHRIAVDAVDAGARHIAQRVAIVGRRGDAAGAGAREPCRDAPRRREQEMAGAAGRIDHRDRQAAPRPGSSASASTRSSTGSSALSSSACTRLSGV